MLHDDSYPLTGEGDVFYKKNWPRPGNVVSLHCMDFFCYFPAFFSLVLQVITSNLLQRQGNNKRCTTTIHTVPNSKPLVSGIHSHFQPLPPIFSPPPPIFNLLCAFLDFHTHFLMIHDSSLFLTLPLLVFRPHRPFLTHLTACFHTLQPVFKLHHPFSACTCFHLPPPIFQVYHPSSVPTFHPFLVPPTYTFSLAPTVTVGPCRLFWPSHTYLYSPFSPSTAHFSSLPPVFHPYQPSVF